MSDLGDRRSVVTVQAPIDNKAAADSRTNRDVENALGGPAGTKFCFGQSSQIAVIVDHRWSIEVFLPALDQGHIVPARDLMAFRDSTGTRINRPAESNANSRDIVLGQQRPAKLFNLSNDTGRAGLRIDFREDQLIELIGLCVANSQLHLRAADFDSEVTHEINEARKRSCLSLAASIDFDIVSCMSLCGNYTSWV